MKGKGGRPMARPSLAGVLVICLSGCMGTPVRTARDGGADSAQATGGTPGTGGSNPTGGSPGKPDAGGSPDAASSPDASGGGNKDAGSTGGSGGNNGKAVFVAVGYHAYRVRSLDLGMTWVNGQTE